MSQKEHKPKIVTFGILGGISICLLICVVLMIDQQPLYRFPWGFLFIPSDKSLISQTFPYKLVGISKITVLKREGASTIGNPRELTLEITLDSYPDQVVCQGRISFFSGDPSYRDFRWNDLECAGEGWLIDPARSWLLPQEGPTRKLCQEEWVALVLIK